MFGGEDINYINQLFTGTDQSSADPVSVKTTWKFRSSKLQIGAGTGGNTFKYTIAGDAIAANRILTIPTVSADRSFVLANALQTISGKTIIRSPTASDTNLYPDVFVLPHLGKRKATSWLGSTFSTAFGFGAGGITGTGVTAATTVNGIGRFANPVTTTGPGTFVGTRGNDSRIATCRALKTRFISKWRVPTTLANTTVWTGFQSNGPTAFASGADPLNNLEGYMIGYRDGTDTNLQIARNSGSGATQFTDTGMAVAFNVLYFVDLRSDGTNFNWSVYNGTTTASGSHSTTIPGSTSALYPQMVLEATAAVTRNFNMFYFIVEYIDP